MSVCRCERQMQSALPSGLPPRSGWLIVQNVPWTHLSPRWPRYPADPLTQRELTMDARGFLLSASVLCGGLAAAPKPVQKLNVKGVATRQLPWTFLCSQVLISD